MRDERTGEFQNSKGERYPVSTTRSDSATYVYIAPELRLGRRIGEHLELSLGAEILLMTALKQPKWDASQQVVTTKNPLSSGDGLGTFASDALVGSFLVFVAPGVGARYDF